MRAAFLYPPVSEDGRVPVLTQSRVFSFTNSGGIRIYPVVMAQAATLLKQLGWDVAWMDGSGGPLTAAEYLDEVAKLRPDLAILETKAPVIRRHWSFIWELKDRVPGVKVVLAGDHVSYFPRESFEACPVDFVAAGGDYDGAVAGIARRLKDGGRMPAGVWRRGKAPREVVPPEIPRAHVERLDDLPWIDRDLTAWRDYGEAYLHRPVAYVMSGRGCGGVKGAGRCTFCIWQDALWGRTARLRDPRNVAREVASLAGEYGVREVFDDAEAGGVWDTEWLLAFTEEMERSGAAGRVFISSNCRADAVTPERCELMKRAGFRLLKIALESGNDETLLRLAKDETVEEIVRGVKLAKDNGFAVMVSTMVGFPWEGEKEVARTLATARELLEYRGRCGDCLEANLVMPYPGTPLDRYMRDNGWAKVAEGDYDRYGRGEPVVESPVDAVAWGRRIWGLHLAPKFLWKVARSIRSPADLGLCLRGARSLVGHLRDYASGRRGGRRAGT